MDRQQVYEELRAFAKRTETNVCFESDGDIVKRSPIFARLHFYTVSGLAGRVCAGHERRCHEELVASIEEFSDLSPDCRVSIAYEASKKALA